MRLKKNYVYVIFLSFLSFIVYFEGRGVAINEMMRGRKDLFLRQYAICYQKTSFTGKSFKWCQILPCV